MVSIIIPLYNKGAYVTKAIQSIYKQTFKEWELIIINDGSTDNSLALARELTGSFSDRVTLVDQVNSGVSVTRNRGVELAKFDYITFLDADDWWESTYLERMMSLVCAFPNAGIYGCSYHLVKNGIAKLAHLGLPDTFTAGILDYFQVYADSLCMPLTSISVVIPRQVFLNEQGFKSSLKIGEDFDLWVRIALKHPVAFLNQPLAYYNQDVDPSNRAIGKLHNPAHHILWNLDYLKQEEQSIPALKKLLDNMRVYGLLPYYINDAYRHLASQELSKVDWAQQPYSSKKYYQWPIALLKAYWYSKKAGSYVKQTLLRLVNQ